MNSDIARNISSAHTTGCEQTKPTEIRGATPGPAPLGCAVRRELGRRMAGIGAGRGSAGARGHSLSSFRSGTSSSSSAEPSREPARRRQQTAENRDSKVESRVRKQLEARWRIIHSRAHEHGLCPSTATHSYQLWPTSSSSRTTTSSSF